jgi:hypothetical protein
MNSTDWSGIYEREEHPEATVIRILPFSQSR